MHKVKNIINQNSLRTLYSPLILPYLTYCAEIWGNTSKTVIDPIIKLQKKAIRIINQTGYLAHTNPLFIKNNLLKLEDLIKLNTLIIAFKAKHKQLPDAIQKLFEFRETKYNLRGINKYRKHFARTETKAHCISVKSVNQWNDLEDELKTCTSLNLFKKMFKRKTINTYKANM